VTEPMLQATERQTDGGARLPVLLVFDVNETLSDMAPLVARFNVLPTEEYLWHLLHGFDAAIQHFNPGFSSSEPIGPIRFLHPHRVGDGRGCARTDAGGGSARVNSTTSCRNIKASPWVRSSPGWPVPHASVSATDRATQDAAASEGFACPSWSTAERRIEPLNPSSWRPFN
jgi:hypothetical protein